MDKYADKRPVRGRQCMNSAGVLKRRYATRDEAQTAAAARPDPRVRPYRCGDCGFWHIGKPSWAESHDEGDTT